MILARHFKKNITLNNKCYIYVTSCSSGGGYTEYIVVDEERHEMLCITVLNGEYLCKRLLATEVELTWTDKQIETTKRYERTNR